MIYIFLLKTILLDLDDTVCTQGLNLRCGTLSSRYCPSIHTITTILIIIINLITATITIFTIIPGCTLHILLGQHCLHMVQECEYRKVNTLLISIRVIIIKIIIIVIKDFIIDSSNQMIKPLPQHQDHGGTPNAWK